MSLPVLVDSGDALIQLVADAVTSPATQRAYARAIRDFLSWYAPQRGKRLSKRLVQRYAQELRKSGLSPANVNQRLSAIRTLAREAADNDLLDDRTAAAVGRVRGIRQEGQRVGKWLTLSETESLLSQPDRHTLAGKRDRALLAVLVGCGLRRREVATLTLEHVQQRDGRWVLVDLVGKRGRVRSVPMPAWCKALLDEWTRAAGIRSGRLFRPVNKGDRLAGESLSAEAVYRIVRRYAPDLAPHDLRRTHAQLARKGGAPLEQIQIALGHSSVQTTERYLGTKQDFQDAPCDRLGIRLER